MTRGMIWFAALMVVMPATACAADTPPAEKGAHMPARPELPYAAGRQFRTLDDYLAFRKTLGATDRPWYEEVSPGIYKLTGGRRLPGSPEPVYTRQELLEKFGFSE